MVDEKALVRAVKRAMENAGTLPAKQAVKLVPADWHRICDLVLNPPQALPPGSTGEAEGLKLGSRLTVDGVEAVVVPKEPNSAQLDRAVAFALNVSLGGDYRWTDYMRDLYRRFLSAAGER